MKVDFRSADFSSLSEIFNETVLPKFAVDPDLLKQKTVADSTFDWGASWIEPNVAFIAIKRSPVNLYRADRDSAYISCIGFRDPTVALDLLTESKNCLIERGIANLYFGTDSGHLFPGCPIDCYALKDFLLIAGFQEGGEAHDLERTLTDFECSVPIPTGYELRPLVSQDRLELERFFDAEFPGRWKYDVLKKIEDEHASEVVFGLFQDRRCLGFALLQQDGCQTQIGGAVWKSDLGPNWCSLGPIGISKEVRKRGLGNALLAKALEFLRSNGGRRCIIDWTGLLEFYGAHGFQVTRTYRYSRLDLESLGTD